jgi:hypothetical protein
VKNPIRITELSALRLAVSAVAVTTAIAGATGIAAERAAAATPPLSSSSAGIVNGLLTINGTGASDRIALRLKAGHPGVLQVDVGDDGSANFSFRRSADPASLGGGDDTFVWDPGDGSDTVAGGLGADTMRFNGAPVAEQMVLSANGGHLKLVRDVGGVTMDTVGVERVDVNAIGGADVVTVKNLIGTGVTAVVADLAGTLGGATGDGARDRVVVAGTSGIDAFNVNGDAGGVKVSRLTSTVEILHSEAANDRLDVNTLAGRDSVDSSGLAAGVVQLFVDGVLRP